MAPAGSAARTVNWLSSAVRSLQKDVAQLQNLLHSIDKPMQIPNLQPLRQVLSIADALCIDDQLLQQGEIAAGKILDDTIEADADADDAIVSSCHILNVSNDNASVACATACTLPANGHCSCAGLSPCSEVAGGAGPEVVTDVSATGIGDSLLVAPILNANADVFIPGALPTTSLPNNEADADHVKAHWFIGGSLLPVEIGDPRRIPHVDESGPPEVDVASDPAPLWSDAEINDLVIAFKKQLESVAPKHENDVDIFLTNANLFIKNIFKSFNDHRKFHVPSIFVRAGEPPWMAECFGNAVDSFLAEIIDSG